MILEITQLKSLWTSSLLLDFVMMVIRALKLSDMYHVMNGKMNLVDV